MEKLANYRTSFVGRFSNLETDYLILGRGEVGDVFVFMCVLREGRVEV